MRSTLLRHVGRRLSSTATDNGNLRRRLWIGGAVAASAATTGAVVWAHQTGRVDFGTITDALAWPFRAVHSKITGMFNEVVSDFADPSKEVLLPPAPPDAFGNTPRTLVLDVEGTLIFNEYERGVGWRPVKRPNADVFLLRMFQAGYEIVTFSSGHQVPSVRELCPQYVTWLARRLCWTQS